MNLLDQITIIIPTHNRHGYLSRLLDYYGRFPGVKIIVADSSDKPYDINDHDEDVRYYYLPGLPLPQKLAFVTAEVNTDYVVMCSDDDFILTEGIIKCIEFLNENPSYVSAQGNSITYKKHKNYSHGIEFNLLYDPPFSFDIDKEDAFERLQRLLSPYRTIFCAVHRSEIIKHAFSSIPSSINNLFLNEYITAVVPIFGGYHKEFNIFFQVREYSETSGDKVTENLDVLFFNEKYRLEVESFLNFVVDKIKSEIQSPENEIKYRLNFILEQFAQNLKQQKLRKESFLKKIGKILSLLPYVGTYVVLKRRLALQAIKLRYIVRSSEDQNNLELIKELIYSYAKRVG